MRERILITASIILLCTITVLRLLYPSPFAATWDEVDFALALDNYDISFMQPHFPGYPFFILGGMIAHIWIENPAEALSMFNTIAVASSAVPVYMLARRRVSSGEALLLAAFLQSGSYLSILATQPMSEGAALAVLWWYIWSLDRAFQMNRLLEQILPLALFALLMGIRLSYAPFGIALPLLWLYDWRRKKNRVIPLISLAVFFQLVWVGALIWNVGGIDGFFKLAFGFVGGHFTEWGGAVTETSEPLSSRLYRLVALNIFWTGLFSRSPLLAGIFILLLAFLVLQWKNLRLRKTLYENRLILLLALVYFLWNLFAQNIDKPRHSYPIVMLLSFSFVMLQLKQRYLFLVFAFAVCQAAFGIFLAKEQATAEPATYQLANFLTEKEKPLTVYTWEETRVMGYLQVPYEHKRFYQYDYFLQDKKYRTDDTIYVTNHLIDGFRSQGIEVEAHLQEVKRFRSNPLFDPIYSEIILYKWIP
ncbi:MAG: hypothetical protein ACE3JP_08120 [Ectobacillus sp.]